MRIRFQSFAGESVSNVADFSLRNEASLSLQCEAGLFETSESSAETRIVLPLRRSEDQDVVVEDDHSVDALEYLLNGLPPNGQGTAHSKGQTVKGIQSFVCVAITQFFWLLLSSFN